MSDLLIQCMIGSRLIKNIDFLLLYKESALPILLNKKRGALYDSE